MVGEPEVSVVARGKFWAIGEDASGVTHVVHIDLNYDAQRVIWGCRGWSTSLDEFRERIRDADIPVTCIDCIARGLP